MATVSHTIYSYYAPKQRVNPTESETALSLGDEPVNPWETENSFPIRQLREPPRFVPATFSIENSIPQRETDETSGTGTGLAGWYKSLTGAGVTSDRLQRPAQPATIAGPSNMLVNAPKKPDTANKNNWFIQKAIQSEPASTSSTPPPTLADILARDPPPLPTETPYTPPVWLALGPSNKGFAMLQQHGWNEGEGLGPHVRRRTRVEGNFLDISAGKAASEPMSPRSLKFVKREEREVQWADDIQEIRNVEVIDLTLSDSEDQPLEADIGVVEPDLPPDISTRGSLSQSHSCHSQTTLLTPIATVLKSDRLGIGLKAKTVGPHKASQKRVTHSAAAVAAHIRAAEDLREKKAESGRGRRGFARMAKKEQERRQQLLAYLNE